MVRFAVEEDELAGDGGVFANIVPKSLKESERGWPAGMICLMVSGNKEYRRKLHKLLC